MIVDTEIRLSGETANEFHNMMTLIDLDSINARDEFISNVSSRLDEHGILTIDISDMDIDLSVMDEDSCEIEAVPVSKQEIYVGAISVQFLHSNNLNINILNERNTSYSIDDYYASEGMYSVNQNVSIKFAA